MRGGALVVLALAILAAHAWSDDAGAPPATQPVGFDHNLHLSRVAASGADPIACARCHAWRGGELAGKPGHAACFAGCHGAAPVAPARGAKPPALPPEELRVCVACHAEATLAAPYAGPAAYTTTYPPYRVFPDHALEIGHRTHAAIACATCHPADRGAARGPPHRRCAACHDGSGAAGHGPAMTGCERCHARASGIPDPPRLLMTSKIEIVVTSAFSHARHAARGGAGRQCATCHAAILETDDRQLPRPTAKDCATGACHDGKAAFPVTAACTKCHKDVPKERFEVERPAVRFSHATHAGYASTLVPTLLPCAVCHSLAKSGEVVVSGHAPCAACHPADFGERKPRTCGACHNATEPWRELKPDRLPADRTEFGASLDHAKHPGACAGCHTLTTATAQLRPPRGHRACTGAACHAITGGPAPALRACEGCHEPARAEARRKARLAAPWSVRATFDHATHRGACATCHTDLGAAGLAALPTPAKATCAGCHDGTAAFKLTGTSCTRCHTGGKR